MYLIHSDCFHPTPSSPFFLLVLSLAVILFATFMSLLFFLFFTCPSGTDQSHLCVPEIRAMFWILVGPHCMHD